MTREWVRQHTAILDDDDYQALSQHGQLAWHKAQLICGRQTDEGRFSSRDALAVLLRKEGMTRAVHAVRELDEHGFIVDIDREGRIEFRGYRKWQIMRGDSMVEYRGRIQQARAGTNKHVHARAEEAGAHERDEIDEREKSKDGARTGNGETLASHGWSPPEDPD